MIRRVLRRLQRLVTPPWGFTLGEVLILGFAVLAIGCIIWAIVAACRSPGLEEWIASIDDPTERGCAYIAVAIGIHAFLQLFVERKVKVEVTDKRD